MFVGKNNKNVLLHLSLIPNVGPATILKIMRGVLLDKYPDLLNAELMELATLQDDLDFENIYNYSCSDFVRKAFISENIAKVVHEGLKDKKWFEEELALIAKHGIDTLTLLDHDYPDILKQIHFPPIILYCKGNRLSAFAKRFSIVGSRKAEKYAQQFIESIIPDLVANDWHIVSGGAEGADTMAHRATLIAKGKTIAVLGSGLLQPYPASNINLFEKIALSGGAVVSPFPLRTMPEKGNFPARNRIISGLSLGCLIVQAAEKSGALITANFALEQGRQVFALPGSVYKPLSLGCHELIKQGAKLVNNVQDILEEFGEVVQVESSSAVQVVPANIIVEPAKEPVLSASIDPIVALLDSASTIDELSSKTGLDLVELQNKLFELQLEGKVKQNFIGSWERVL